MVPVPHDNDTTRGWWQALEPTTQDYVRRYLGVDARGIEWDLIRAASASVASRAIVPMQDVLGLGSEARMNHPGVAEGSWTWRFGWAQVAPWRMNCSPTWPAYMLAPAAAGRPGRTAGRMSDVPAQQRRRRKKAYS